ncbi:hypothetical protein [Halobacillus sp. Marseille-Q1614]|uniref:hypothetical protein n=1 Tax=Halobacillus sp. Marseille-Q1614 TaxID=2709134 RepID=UPI00156FDF2C|nr:hypothetical protein [Halobacillus sp. Marseille-Q1614]
MGKGKDRYSSRTSKDIFTGSKMCSARIAINNHIPGAELVIFHDPLLEEKQLFKSETNSLSQKVYAGGGDR